MVCLYIRHHNLQNKKTISNSWWPLKISLRLNIPDRHTFMQPYALCLEDRGNTQGINTSAVGSAGYAEPGTAWKPCRFCMAP
jgi:hypothetical protein